LPTWWARLYLAGDVNEAQQVCRAFCLSEGLCVTVEACDYIYPGGAEAGYCVGLVNYPRFPENEKALRAKAKQLAKLLMEKTCQQSAMITTPTSTEWISTRKGQ